VLAQLSKDKIPNIRMNVAKAILVVRQKLKAGTQMSPVENAIESELLNILMQLKDDRDDDVKFFTRKAIALQ